MSVGHGQKAAGSNISFHKLVGFFENRARDRVERFISASDLCTESGHPSASRDSVCVEFPIK